MYSKRRSNRAPGSVHWPCTFQLVLIMQNAEPQDAPASAAALIATAANSSRFISISRQKAMTRAARGRAHSDHLRDRTSGRRSWEACRKLRRRLCLRLGARDGFGDARRQERDRAANDESRLGARVGQRQIIAGADMA